MGHFRTVILAVSMGLVLGAPSTLHAAPSPRAGAAPLEGQLASDDASEVRAAIDALLEQGTPAALQAVADFLRAGQPDSLTDYALEAMGASGDAATLDILVEFTRHRRAGARLRAYRALGRLEGAAITTLVAEGLRDESERVRAHCARLLGQLGARDQLDLLFQAFSLGVHEAGVAIGKLADESQVARFDEHLGRQPLGVMLAGYQELLQREDIPQATKLRIVATLGEVSGGQVKRFLQRLLASGHAKGDPKLSKVIRITIGRIKEQP